MREDATPAKVHASRRTGESLFSFYALKGEIIMTNKEKKIALSRWKRLSRKEKAFLLAICELDPKSQSDMHGVLLEALCGIVPK